MNNYDIWAIENFKTMKYWKIKIECKDSGKVNSYKENVNWEILRIYNY